MCQWIQVEEQIKRDCAELGGTYSEREHQELDANENVVDTEWFQYCYIKVRAGWMEFRYDLTTGSAEPVEVCRGLRGRPGTCFEL